MSRMKQGWWNLGERNCRYCLKWMCIAMLVSHFYLLFIFYLFILLVYAFFFFDSICFLSSEFIHVNWHMVMKNIYCSSSKTVKSEEKKIYFSFLWHHLSVSAGAPPWTSNPPMSDRETECGSKPGNVTNQNKTGHVGSVTLKSTFSWALIKCIPVDLKPQNCSVCLKNRLHPSDYRS